MDNVITFTVNQLIGFVTTVGGCIVVIEAVVLIIFKLVSKVKAPEVEQNNRIRALEEENKSRKEEIEELKKRIGEGDDHFTELEKTNKVILRTLQALLNLSLGVSDTEALKKVSEDLNDFILNK